MVYRGKPSRGCENCRNRKIKCDRTEGGCLNCSKASSTCPGYRNEVDLMFLDESQHTADKIAHRANKLRLNMTTTTTAKQRKTPVPDLPLEGHQLARRIGAAAKSPTDSVSYQPDLSIDNLSTHFFLLHFTINSLSPESAYSSGPVSVSTDALSACMKAVGCAGLASSRQSVDYETALRALYVSAVQSVKKALWHQDESKNDRTLLAVMLLGHFEEMDLRFGSSMSARKAHLQGAVALLKLRGTKRLQNPMQIRHFVQLISALTHHCIQHQTPLPEEIIDLTEHLRLYTHCEDPFMRYFYLKIQFTQLYSQVRDVIKHSNDHPNTNFQVLLDEALNLDHQFDIILLNLPPGWSCRRYPVPDSQSDDPLLPSTYFTIYDYYISVSTYNGIRTCRILLHKLILDLLPLISPSDQTQYAISTSLITNLSLDILSSLPQYLGMISPSPPRPTPPPILHPYKPNPKAPRFLWTGFRSFNHDTALKRPMPLRPKPTPSSTPKSSSTSLSKSPPASPPIFLPLPRNLNGTDLVYYLYIAGSSGTTDTLGNKLSASTADEIDVDRKIHNSAIRALRIVHRDFGIGSAGGFVLMLESGRGRGMT